MTRIGNRFILPPALAVALSWHACDAIAAPRDAAAPAPAGSTRAEASLSVRWIATVGPWTTLDEGAAPFCVWNRERGQVILAKPDADHLAALDATTGELRWSYMTGGPIAGPPAIVQGDCFVASDDGAVCRLREGRVVWAFQAALSDQKMIDAAAGRILSAWPVRGLPCVADGAVYFAAGMWPFMGISIYAVEAESGRLRWFHDLKPRYVAQPHGTKALTTLIPQGPVSVEGDLLLVPAGSEGTGVFDRKSGGFILLRGSKAPAARKKPAARPGRDHDEEGSSRRAGIERALNEAGLARERIDRARPLLRNPDGLQVLFVPPADVIGVGPGAAGKPAIRAAIGEAPRPGAAGQDAHAAAPDRILAAADVREGYALVAGRLDAALLAGLARRSRLSVVAVESDPARLDALRKDLLPTGLYGRRVAALGPGSLRGLPPCFASLIVWTGSAGPDAPRTGETAASLWAALRPYGGVVCMPDPNGAGTAELAAELERLGGTRRPRGDCLLIARDGGLPGAGAWANPFGDAGNSYSSGDQRVQGPLGVIWFGGEADGRGEGPHGVAFAEGTWQGRTCPIKNFRHPLVAGGRMFVHTQVNGTVAAFDAYTGRFLWKKPGLDERCVAAADGFYSLQDKAVLCLAPATGERVGQIGLEGLPGTPREIRIQGEWLVVSATGGVACLDRKTGRAAWRRSFSTDPAAPPPKTWFFHWPNFGFAVGPAGVYCIYGVASRDLKEGETFASIVEMPRACVIGLDLRTGSIRWIQPCGPNEPMSLQYFASSDVLLSADPGSVHGWSAFQKDRPIKAFRGLDGAVLWQKRTGYAAPLFGIDRTVSGHKPFAWYELASGEPASRPHPITGEPIAPVYERDYGCAYAVAGAKAVFFRSGTAAYLDWAGGSGVVSLGGTRAGCSMDLIPADGVVCKPNFAHGCICRFSLYTAFGLAPLDDAQMWGVAPDRYSPQSIRRVGFNLGAPGTRRDPDGTMWLAVPPIAPSADTSLQIEPANVSSYYFHEQRIAGGAGPRWVLSSGCVGARRVRLSLDPAGRYRLRLYFAEPEDREKGQRVFDVAVNGRPPVTLDIAVEAGGPRRGLVKEFEIDGRCEVEFTPRAGPAVLSGIEIVRRVAGVPVGRNE